MSLVNLRHRAPSAVSIDTVWMLLGLLVPFLVAATNPLQDDIWWTLKLGELIATGGLLREELLTFPPHEEYVHHQWLAQLLYYGAYRLLDLPGVAFANALLVTGAFAITLHLAVRTGAPPRVASPCVMAASVAAASNFAPRAQSVALLLFALTYWLLNARPARWRLGALAGIELVWANAHGSFGLGPSLTTAFLVAQLVQKDRSGARYLVLAAAGQLLATLATPHGVDLYGYVLRAVSHPINRAFIVDWRPPSSDDLSGTVFLASLAFTAGLLFAQRHSVRFKHVLIAIWLGALALVAMRNVVWWALAMPPIWAAYLFRTVAPSRTGPALVNAGLATLIVGFLLTATPWTKAANPLLPEARRTLVGRTQPVLAADFLAAQRLPERVFTFQRWGGYLQWRLWPQYLPMVDGRVEVRPASMWEDYAVITYAASGWEERLSQYQIRVLVLSIEDQPALVHAVEDAARSAGASPAGDAGPGYAPSWARVHADGVAVIYVKK